MSVAIGGMLISCSPATGSGHGGSGGTGGGGNGGTGGSGANGGGPCVGLQCQQMQCPGGGSTTLTGKVFAPNGTLPLYNAIVYVPNTAPAPFTSGVTCDRCNGSVSGDPVTITTTDAAGNFSLTNVPVGNNIPLVIQMGKWRVQKTIPTVPSCVSTPLDAGTTSLPKNHSQGDMPQMAIATGSADPFECLLLKIGIDPAEITTPAGSGRVHFYLGETKPGTRMNGAPSEGDATNGIYTSLTKMLTYDVIMLPCEGTNNYSGTTGPQRNLLVQYLNAGGRIFSTHYSYQWLTYGGSPYNAVSTDNGGNGWNVDQPMPCGQNSTCGYIGTIDQSFPKGMAFSQWLGNVTAPPVNGSFEITDPRNDLDALNPATIAAQRWMYHMGDNKVLHATFNTPLNPPPDDMGQPQYCGRVVFSDFHVSANEAQAGGTFPGACMSGALTTQEKALAFMLFDLSSCVQSDQTPPIP
ncbi:MAG TPA: carboxypeptidase-like regulatory domain-containing protein [Polyangia bacterium]